MTDRGNLMKKIVSMLSAAAALLLAGAAHAEGYFGVGGGVTSNDVDCTGASSCDRTATGLKLFGGYKFNRTLAIEGGYYNFGKVTATVPVDFFDVDVAVKPVAYVVNVALHGDLTPQVNVVGRLGVASTHLRVDGSTQGITVTDSENSTQPFTGFGIGYRLNPTMTMGLDADFTRAKYDGESISVQLYTASFSWSF
jgi:OOP family OmpA-OmpF porin